MVKHRKWLDAIMLCLCLIVIATALVILVDFLLTSKIDKNDENQSDFVLGLAFFIILLTFSSVTLLLIPVALYLFKSIHSKYIIECINKRKPVRAFKFPFTKILLIALYICEIIVVLISTTSFEVMLEAILTNDKTIYILRSGISVIQNVVLSVFIIFIVDYLKNKLKEEDEVRILLDAYNGLDLNRKIKNLDKGRIGATINVTIITAFIFFFILIFRIIDAAIVINSGGSILMPLTTIFIYLEGFIFFSLGVCYFKTEEKIFKEINGIIDNANKNI